MPWGRPSGTPQGHHLPQFQTGGTQGLKRQVSLQVPMLTWGLVTLRGLGQEALLRRPAGCLCRECWAFVTVPVLPC